MSDVVSDLVTGTFVPAPIKRNLIKAFSRLCSAAIDLPVAYLEGKSDERRAETQARIKLIDTTACQISEQMRIDPEYAHRAITQFGNKVLREQVNLDMTVARGMADLRENGELNEHVTEETSETEIDDDWLNNFETEARMKSTDDCTKKFKEYFIDPTTSNSRFTYQTRCSSTDFFDALANYAPRSSAENTNFVKEMIIDEPWYFRSWRLDTTVQSSLTMLEAIHEQFSKTRQNLFCRLVDENQSRITFQLLNLGEFNLNDDLYIKMNARGIPLTPFEIFKSRYTQHLDTIFTGDSRDLDGHKVSVAEYFARRMDTKWADFFWHHRDRNTNLYDKAAINFFRVVAMVTRDPTDSESYLKSLRNYRDRGVSSSYSSFMRFNWLDRNLTKGIFLLLDVWSSGNDSGFANQLPDDKYFDETKIFEKFVEDPILSFVEIVQLTGYVMYLQKHEKNIDSKEFQHWMRVVYNLSVNDVYDRPDDVRRSVLRLNKIVSEIGSEFGETLKYFANPYNEISDFREQQINEERAKATLILRNYCWAELIYEAEGHGYFKGQIEFLLDFCGILGEIHNVEIIELDENSNREFQNRFKRYFELAKSMFNSSGLIDERDFRWERALLTIGDYLLLRRLNHSFLVNDRGDMLSWKRFLRDGTEKREYLRRLWDRLDENDNIRDQLDEIINGCPNLEPWRLEIVKSPEAIRYCLKRSIRKDENNGVIYLLRSTQMNGWYVELLTYCLYQRLKSANFESDFPNWVIHYDEVYGTYTNPGILLTWCFQGQKLELKMEYEGETFVIFPAETSLQENSPELFGVLVNDADFAQENGKLQRVVSYSEVTQRLEEFMKVL